MKSNTAQQAAAQALADKNFAKLLQKLAPKKSIRR